MALSAKALDEQYGPELSRPPLADCESAYYLHQALRTKGIDVSHEVCKVWLCKYRVVPGQVRISSAQELEEQHGEGTLSLPRSIASAGFVFLGCRLNLNRVGNTDDSGSVM